MCRSLPRWPTHVSEAVSVGKSLAGGFQATQRVQRTVQRYAYTVCRIDRAHVSAILLLCFAAQPCPPQRGTVLYADGLRRRYPVGEETSRGRASTILRQGWSGGSCPLVQSGRRGRVSVCCSALHVGLHSISSTRRLADILPFCLAYLSGPTTRS